MALDYAATSKKIVDAVGGAVEGVAYGMFLGQQATYLFGFLPVVCASYSSSVLPMLLMTPVMGWAEDFADKVSPNVLKAFLKPMIFLLICTPVVFVVLGPIGAILGNLLAAGMSALYNAVPWLTVGILSAAMPFIVMTGMHYALIPLMFQNMASLGFDVVVLVTMFCSNICQGGAGESALFGDLGVKGISKATAVDALLRHLGASREDTIAFGDAKVDIPMFEVCAYSVCMGSGGEEAKAAADYATSGVNEDGLFRAFQALHLIDAPAPSESN